MVIQRLQNLYLLIAAILLAVFAFMPAVNIVAGDDVYNITALGVNTSTTARFTPGLIVLTVLTVLFVIMTISKFKKLKLQKSMCGICILLNIAQLAVIGILAYLTANGSNLISIQPYLALPLVAIILEFMARDGIKKDIKLLSDSSRLR